ncbi:TrkH family potassium uptake protein [Paenibacillus aurantius]|uniref:TrkH family potassium uptake protein n=1 Tax=Paenibacillus aurantius TaxID=2918900 RepID=A0AA96LF76_9BACL|nr:TrkH family potassium uptake protein [Paenibacillus aurantius]WNQ12651.1 TrkH family potassium uptake protein [Paenibacillus aurantius]
MNVSKRKFSLFRLTPPQILVIGFAIIILTGAALLTLPVASTDGIHTPFLDALFTATSATCVTGLVVVDTGTHWTLFGQVVIILLIQIGGLGFMTMGTLIALVIRKKISLRERLILQEAMNQGSMEGIVRLIRRVLLYALTIEAAGAALLTIRWSFDMPFGKALYYGVWHGISMFNNAGFDLFGGINGKFSSLTGYVDDPIVNFTVMALIVLGGLGFIVIADVHEFRKTRKLSLHSKVVLSATAFLIVFGAMVICAFEFTNPATLGPLSPAGKIWASLFASVTPRTAGANTIDVAGMRQATQFFTVILMFIGASPGSTGGGVKTTTFTILIGAMIAMIRGKEDIVLFRNRLAKDRIYKAITLTFFALFLVVFVTMLLSTTEDYFFLKILFEVTSAFGTVGLSMGLTPDLSTIGKILIALMMFIGRLGPLTLAYALGPRPEKELYRYPEGKVTIG